MNFDLLCRFWSRVERRGPDECWPWTAGKSNGYGRISAGRPSLFIYLSHRLSWEIHNGPIPVGMVLLHRCDNPPCVNPAHLSLGTQLDNIADATVKGRVSRGERHVFSKLKTADVLEIRRLLSTGMMHKEIAKKFGVTRSHVTGISSGRFWVRELREAA